MIEAADIKKDDLQKRLEYQFKKAELLTSALTHKSLVQENKNIVHNEKLEFLGDAVLDLLLADLLMSTHNDATEGQLSKRRASLVNEEKMCLKAKALGLDSILMMSKGETLSGGMNKPRLLASSYEALMGAIYLDGGIDACRKIVEKHYSDDLVVPLEEGIYSYDFKSRLQELVQKAFQVTPTYELVSETGPSHERVFCVRVLFKDHEMGLGVGKSKKTAEQEAAKLALENLQKDTII